MGAESFLAAPVPRCAGAGCAELGLGERAVHPTAATAAVRRPAAAAADAGRHAHGRPRDLARWPGSLSRRRRSRRRRPSRGRPFLAAGADVAVGALVRARFGDEVVDRLVDPLLGGVYAGRADDLVAGADDARAGRGRWRRAHAAAAAPRRASTPCRRRPGHDRSGRSRTAGRGLEPDSSPAARPAHAARASVRLGATVRDDRARIGDRLAARGLGSTTAPGALDVDAVVLAVPARPAARLLAAGRPGAAVARRRAGLRESSVVVRAGAAARATPLPGSRARSSPASSRPRGQGRDRLSHASGPHLGRATARASARVARTVRRGRSCCSADDDALVALVHADLGTLLGGRAPRRRRPRDSDGAAACRSTRRATSTGSRRSGRVRCRRGLAGRGAAYDGVGIPVCIGTGQRAADRRIARIWSGVSTSSDGRRRTPPGSASSTTSIRYTMWSVFRAEPGRLGGDRAAVAAEVDESCSTQLAAKDVVVRGIVRRRRPARRRRRDGLVARRDVDAPAGRRTRGLRRTALGRAPAPGLVADGAAPAGRVQQEPPAGVPGRRGAARRTSASTRSSGRTSGTCCPTRSAATMLAEHGQMARDYPDVRANTVACVRARRLRVDPRVRGRRAAPDRRPDARPAGLRARRHVREEVPFYTGRAATPRTSSTRCPRRHRVRRRRARSASRSS